MYILLCLVSLIVTEFKKFIDKVLYCIFHNIQDRFLYVPYLYQSIHSFYLDGKDYTNRGKIFLYFKWNKDFGGIHTSDLTLLKEDIDRLAIVYTKDITHLLKYSIQSNELTINGNPSEVLFEELIFL